MLANNVFYQAITTYQITIVHPKLFKDQHITFQKIFYNIIAQNNTIFFAYHSFFQYYFGQKNI